jgi:two-component sensor histidine kinase
MQIISSLVELESFTAEPKLKDILKDIQGRVMSMALIHEKLYSNKGLSQINLQDYTKTLMNEILHSYDLYSFIKINLEVNENILLNLDTSVPLGLILNELITNSLKHGFKGRKKDSLSLHTDGQNIILIYQDEGKGLPQSFDIDNNETIGIQLIKGLTEQIDGQLTLKSYNPPIFIIKI